MTNSLLKEFTKICKDYNIDVVNPPSVRFITGKAVDLEKFKRIAKSFSIGAYQVLSEEFIDYFKEELSWSLLCTHQVLSEEFIWKHLDYMNWNLFLNRPYTIAGKRLDYSPKLLTYARDKAGVKNFRFL